MPGNFVRELTSQGLKNEWIDVVHADTTAPEMFAVQLAHDANTFQGKYFIIFSTVDKQSGVQHFEVSEDDPMRLGFVRGKPTEKALFVNAQSPYVLSDQELKSRVVVRAYDHAGNVSEAILSPQNGTSSAMTISPQSGFSRKTLGMLGGALLVLLLVGLVVRKRRGMATRQENVS
jgi:hypothetical protein